MTQKLDLQSREAECSDVNEFIELAKQALDDPEDMAYAEELVEKAEMKCQDPGEYVNLAKFLTVRLEDTDAAADILEQAEDSCFEPMEFAEVGHAYATLLNDTAKGQELIRNCASDVSGADLTRLAEFASQAGDSELAASLISGVTSDLKELSEFQQLARKMVDSGSVEEAKVMFQGAERFLESVAETVQYAKSVLDLFDDREQADKLLENAEMDCQFPADYTALASGYRDVLGDEARIDELLAEAGECAMEGEEFLDVARGYWELKRDKDAARENYEQALPDISDRSVLLEIASIAATDLEDQELARQCYEKTAEKITSPGDLAKLAVETWEKLADTEYTKQLFIQAESRMANASDLVSLAELVMGTLDDRDMAQSIYGKAVATIESFSGLQRILESQRGSVNDPKLALEVLRKMKLLAASTNELIATFESARSSVDDADLCRNTLKVAEDMAASPADLESVKAAAEEFAPDDEAWLTILDDKIQRRRVNQAKYTQMQKRESQISSALEFMRLARAVVSELDDFAYARKLIDQARELLENEHFDGSQWQMLVQMAASELKDAALTEELAATASSSCPHFSGAYQLAGAVRDAFDDETGRELAHKILAEWDAKMADADGRIKSARAVLEIARDRDWVETILGQCDVGDFDMLQLAELGDIAFKIGDDAKAQEFQTAALEKCQSTSDLLQLVNRLKASGVSEDCRRSLYRDGRKLISESLEQLRWTEGILVHFGDYAWAKDAYDELQTAITDGALLNAFRVSRRQRLERRL